MEFFDVAIGISFGIIIISMSLVALALVVTLWKFLWEEVFKKNG